MTKFTDGPAADVVLALRRAPLFLRAVQDKAGNWDALDQLNDTPGANETVTVYRKVEDCGQVHVCIRGKGKRASGWYAMATYELHEPQPSVEECRDTAKWQEWCQANAEQWVMERARRRAEGAVTT